MIVFNQEIGKKHTIIKFCQFLNHLCIDLVSESTPIFFSRSKYNRPGQKIIFVAATDDPKWLKANLRGNDVVFTSDLFSRIEITFTTLSYSQTLSYTLRQS